VDDDYYNQEYSNRGRLITEEIEVDTEMPVRKQELLPLCILFYIRLSEDEDIVIETLKKSLHLLLQI